MVASSGGRDTPKEGQDDGPTLPELLTQAGALGAVLAQQQTDFVGTARAQLAAVPGLVDEPGPAPADGPPDFPKLIKQLQDELKQGEAKVGSLVGALGIAVPAGVGADGMIAALASFARGVVGSHVIPGMPPLSPDPVMASGPPDFPSLIKNLLGEQAAAQKEVDALYTARGIDPAHAEQELARLAPVPADAAPATPAGFPGADQVAAMQAGTQKLESILAALATKITPR